VSATESPVFNDNAYARLEARGSEFLLRILISGRLPPKTSAFTSTIELLKKICTVNREFARMFGLVEMIVDRREEVIFN